MRVCLSNAEKKQKVRRKNNNSWYVLCVCSVNFSRSSFFNRINQAFKHKYFTKIHTHTHKTVRCTRIFEDVHFKLWCHWAYFMCKCASFHVQSRVWAERFEKQKELKKRRRRQRESENMIYLPAHFALVWLTERKDWNG